jgi:hypothetical protein
MFCAISTITNSVCICVVFIDTCLSIDAHRCHIRRFKRSFTQNHVRFVFFGFNHRLNIKLDLLGLFGLHVYSCILIG